MTTFWPDMSVDTAAVGGCVARPLRPVTMNASLGPATLIRERTNMTSSRTRRTAPPMAMSRGMGVPSLRERGSVGLDHARWSSLGACTTKICAPSGMRLVGPGVELDRLAGDAYPHLAVAAGRDRGDHHAERADQVVPGRGWRRCACSAPPGSAGPPATRWAPRRARRRPTAPRSSRRTPPSSSLTMAAPKPNAPRKPGDRLDGDRTVDAGMTEVQQFPAEQGQGQHADARPTDDQKDERPRGHDLHGSDPTQRSA